MATNRKKFVYLFETGSLNATANCYQFYDTDIYSSQAKVDHRVKNSIEVNKGSELVVEENDYPSFNGGKFTLYTYKCLTADGDKEMSIRYKVTKKEVQ